MMSAPTTRCGRSWCRCARPGKRAAALTRQLLAFSRRQILEPHVISLTDAVRGLEPMLKRLIGEHVTVHVNVPGPVGPVLADAGQIEQVILNLSINARDAMAQGGVLTIEVTERELDADNARAIDLDARALCDAGGDRHRNAESPPTRSSGFSIRFSRRNRSVEGLAWAWRPCTASSSRVAEPSRSPRSRSRGSTFRVYLPRVDRPA